MNRLTKTHFLIDEIIYHVHPLNPNWGSRLSDMPPCGLFRLKFVPGSSIGWFVHNEQKGYVPLISGPDSYLGKYAEILEVEVTLKTGAKINYKRWTYTTTAKGWIRLSPSIVTTTPIVTTTKVSKSSKGRKHPCHM